MGVIRQKLIYLLYLNGKVYQTYKRKANAIRGYYRLVNRCDMEIDDIWLRDGYYGEVELNKKQPS